SLRMTAEHDRDLQRFLDGKDPISEALRQRPEVEPPPALDAAILAEARAEAERPVRPRWLVPMSVAATVVLGAGLTLRLQNDVPLTESVPESAIAAQAENVADYAADKAEAIARTAADAPAPRPSIDDIPELEIDRDITPRRPDVAADDMALEAGRAARQESLYAPSLPALAPPVATAPAVVAEPALPPPPAAAKEPAPVVAQASEPALMPMAEEAPVPKIASGAAFSDEAELAASSSDAENVAGEIQEVIVTGSRSSGATGRVRRAQALTAVPADTADLDDVVTVSAAPPPLWTDERIAEELSRIRRLVKLGQADEAQARLDDMAAQVDGLELPDDFPLEPSEPDSD
ncbi:MAG: hypothetical protein AAFU65_14255, partial [Pseudomonadota bacterium]